MRDRLIELLLNSDPLHERDLDDDLVDGEIEAIADHLLKSGVIVPPCKVGDAVYRVSFVHKTVEMLKVEGFLRNVASWKVHCTKFIPNWLGNQKEHIYIQFSAFGKTVFLTCEEAEKALAEREGKE